jgi:hypothetical protein
VKEGVNIPVDCGDAVEVCLRDFNAGCTAIGKRGSEYCGGVANEL